ncbi:UNVERIFIED_CONTAM: hypothetical protein K2H54_035850 [Gekko kuhli]
MRVLEGEILLMPTEINSFQNKDMYGHNSTLSPFLCISHAFHRSSTYVFLELKILEVEHIYIVFNFFLFKMWDTMSPSKQKFNDFSNTNLGPDKFSDNCNICLKVYNEHLYLDTQGSYRSPVHMVIIHLFQLDVYL